MPSDAPIICRMQEFPGTTKRHGYTFPARRFVCGIQETLGPWVLEYQAAWLRA